MKRKYAGVNRRAVLLRLRRKEAFPESAKAFKVFPEVYAWERKMSRFFFAVLMASSLFLTAYFGVVAWRLSDEGHLDITGQIRPVAK